MAKYRRFILAVRASSTVPLDAVAPHNGKGMEISVPPIDMADIESLHRLRVAIRNLSGCESRVAMSLCEGHSLRETAAQLGVSESYVFVLKTRMIGKLRGSLRLPVTPSRIGVRT